MHYRRRMSRRPGLGHPTFRRLVSGYENHRKIKKRLLEKRRQLPQDLRTPVAEVRVPVALTTNGSAVEMTAQSLRTQVYEYIKNCDGRMSIVQCASQLDVGPKDVQEVILRLKDEGKITLS